ncbi:MAG: YjcZ family sporulation protein [Nitrososphaeraceae archaeon]
MKKSSSVPITIAVTVMLLITAQVTSANIAIAGGYTKSQVASLDNDCGNGSFLFNVLCQTLESQTQGDGNAINVIGVQTDGEFELDSEWLSGVDEEQLLSAFEWLKANGIDKELFEEIDKQQLLSAFEWLKANGMDKELLSGSNTVNSAGYGGGFVLILVLFILLVIIGAGFGFGGVG